MSRISPLCLLLQCTPFVYRTVPRRYAARGIVTPVLMYSDNEQSYLAASYNTGFLFPFSQLLYRETLQLASLLL